MFHIGKFGILGRSVVSAFIRFMSFCFRVCSGEFLFFHILLVGFVFRVFIPLSVNFKNLKWLEFIYLTNNILSPKNLVRIVLLRCRDEWVIWVAFRNSWLCMASVNWEVVFKRMVVMFLGDCRVSCFVSLWSVVDVNHCVEDSDWLCWLLLVRLE